MIIFTRLSIAIISLALPLTAVFGQNPDSPVEEIVIIANRVPIPLRQIGTSVSALTESDLAAHGNLLLVDVLRQLPAIGTSNNGGVGKPTSLRIRGEEGFRTLVLFDGMRLLDPSTPQIGANFEQIMTSGVSRVEVLRGPQGLSYGADAGGVVSISSRANNNELMVNVDVEAGQFGTRQLNGDVSGGNGQVDYFVSLTDFQTDGFNSRLSDTQLQDHDGYDNTTFHGRIGFQATEFLRVDLVHRQVDGDTRYDGCFSGTTVHDCSSEFAQNATRLSVDYSTDSFTHTFSYANTDTDRQDYALAAPAFGAKGELQRWEYVGSLNGLPGFGLVYGADLEDALSNDSSRDNVGFYLEYLSDFSNTLFVTAGVRHDDNDDFGNNTSYRLSGAYLFELGNATLKFRGSYGTGFRAPSPYEIEYNTGPFASPPASLVRLNQEKSKGYELGIEYTAGAILHLELLYFDQQVRDAINFDLAGFSGYLQDSGISKSDGIEFAANYRMTDNLALSGNVTYNDTRRPNGQQRILRPKWLANLGLSFQGRNERLTVNGFFRQSRDSIDEVFGSKVALDDFTVLDLNAHYTLTDNLRIFARLENALDEDYREITDFNSPKRAAYVGVKFSF